VHQPRLEIPHEFKALETRDGAASGNIEFAAQELLELPADERSEREIMIQVAAGRLNKQIADDMRFTESIVEVHRTNLMRRIEARSLPTINKSSSLR
jgi:FixJ family two-component response regulator